MGDKITSGPTGMTVAANVKHHRQRLGLSFAALSRRLDDIGSPIPVLGLSRIESLERRVSVDDLAALASVLQITVVALLMPLSQGPDELTVGYSGAAAHLTRYEVALELGMDPEEDPSLRQELVTLLTTSSWDTLPPSLTFDHLAIWGLDRVVGLRQIEKGIVDGDD